MSMNVCNTSARIAELNDGMRVRGLTCLMAYRIEEAQRHGMYVMTSEIARHPELRKILEKIVAFSEFREDDDPYGEHDFGAIDHDEERIFWKIEYYDPSMVFASADPARPEMTRRVMTIMFASEY